MSKLQLKKILRTMTAEDLAALVLEVYDARKEAKEYLEFYINPDIEAKRLAAMAEIDKELHRVHRRVFSPRLSKVRAAIKHFLSYSPDDDTACLIYVEVIEQLCRAANANYIKESFISGTCQLLAATLNQLGKSGLLPDYFQRLDKAVDSLNTAHYDSRQLREEMHAAIEQWLKSHNLSS